MFLRKLVQRLICSASGRVLGGAKLLRVPFHMYNLNLLSSPYWKQSIGDWLSAIHVVAQMSTKLERLSSYGYVVKAKLPMRGRS